MGYPVRDILRLLFMTKEDWFGSPFYKLLYQNRDEQEAQGFIENLLRYLHPPQGCKMLDIACGDGRFAIQLAGDGFDVTGIDISLASIERALIHEQDNLHFLVQDMRFVFYINYFDFAFNFFTSFGYFKYNRDHKLAAKSFAASLKQGGTLVIDYLNVGYVSPRLLPESTVIRGEYTFNIKKRLEGNHIIKEINFTDAANEEKHFTERVAAFNLSDFTGMFNDAGMALEHTFGDYQLNPYNEVESPRMIMVFKKN